MSKERAAKIANSPAASKHGGEKSGSGSDSSQGGTTAQKKAAGRQPPGRQGHGAQVVGLLGSPRSRGRGGPARSLVPRSD